MSGDLETAPPLVDPRADEAIQEAMASIAAPGSYFTGGERLALAANARLARGLSPGAPELPPVVAEAAARVAVEAMTSRVDHVATWESDGRNVLAYVELVAVVALICSIDSYRVALGAELDPLPDPGSGDPDPTVDERALKTNAWVPTVGPALAPTALSALPNEKATKAALGAVWYLTDDVIHQYDVEPGRELSRPQMELVASRTSWLNECFF